MVRSAFRDGCLPGERYVDRHGTGCTCSGHAELSPIVATKGVHRAIRENDELMIGTCPMPRASSFVTSRP